MQGRKSGSWLVVTLTALAVTTPFFSSASAGVRHPVASGERVGGSDSGDRYTHRIPTKRLVFYSNIDRGRLAAYAEFADAFLELVDSQFVKIERGFPLNAIVFPDRTIFQEFLRTRVGVRNPPNYGIYLGDHKAFVTYDGSGLGTFTHEIMHAVVEENMRTRPRWAMEGIPAFFEKFYGYRSGKLLVLRFGYQNPWRIQGLGDRLVSLSLKEIVERSTDTSELRLVSVFLYEQGRFKSFLDLVRAGDRKGYSTFLEAALGRTFAEIEPAWRLYLGTIAGNRSKILTLPASSVLPTEEAFREFAKLYGL